MEKHKTNHCVKMEVSQLWSLKTFLSLLLLLLTYLSSSPVVCYNLRINSDGGYENLVISVTDEVPPIICQQFLQNIQAIFTSASDYLLSATEKSAYFHQIVVVLPETWDVKACGDEKSKILLPKEFVSASSIHKAPFVITDEHPIFGHAPYTQQSQGCGFSGDFISMGYRFLLPSNDTSDNWGLYPERSIIHEWTKYRYGVFEEIGFENDPVYPLSYTTSNNPTDNQLKPNVCTNDDLDGEWSGSSCKDSPTRENCVFTLNATSTFLNGNITSSIMSLPNLPHVRKYCDSTDHNDLAPSKHNFMCEGRSIEEVITSHPDFKSTVSPQDSQNQEKQRVKKRIVPNIIVKQLVRPRFVLVIEESASMNLRDVWKFLRLATRKFIKYDLESGTEIGLITVNTDINTLANMTVLTDSVRGKLGEKLPNYPSSVENKGSLALRKGISQAINMLKLQHGGKTSKSASGSVIILISQGTISKLDIDGSLHLLQQEGVSIATIDYPSSNLGDGRVSVLSQKTNSPFYSIRETPVGASYSHMSTYVQLVNAMADIQRFFSQGTGSKYPHLIHQEEFRGGDSLSFVESSFHFFNPQISSINSLSSVGQFHIYIPNPIDPKVNKVELTSPDGQKYTDQLSFLHDINVIKIDAPINKPGLWTYRIERLGDSYQSHFVQVVSMTTNGGGSSREMMSSSTGTTSNSNQPLTVRVFSNRDETRQVDMGQHSLILYADVKRGSSPVLGAHVEAFIVPADGRAAGWSTELLDSGNGDPDITQGDGIYSRYIVPPITIRDGPLDFTVKVKTDPKSSKFIETNLRLQTILPMNNDNNINNNNLLINNIIQNPPCCGSVLASTKRESNSLRVMPYTESVSSSYSVKVTNIKSSHIYPPNRVGDLQVIDFLDKNITFQFTASGNDFDQGMAHSYEFYISDNRISHNNMNSNNGAINVGVHTFKAETAAGQLVNVTIPFSSYNIFYVWLVAIDPYKLKSQRSNIVEVNVLNPSLIHGNSDLLADGDTAAGSGPGKSGRKMNKNQIAYTVVGVVGFCILVICLIILCICCRRKASKKEVNSSPGGETKVFTIPHVKEPIHWSASELLQEHEKRQSIYAQSHSKLDDPSQLQQQQQQRQGVYGHSQNRHSQSHFNNGSPGSSTRSFRSFTEGQYRTSFDSTGRRPTLTDYESCSSDPILKGGPTDYDTAVDSDQDPDYHYRTIDSYVGAAYRANHSMAMMQQQQYQQQQIYAGGGQRSSVDGQQQQLPHSSINTTGTPVQYNTNYQGSLTSVTSSSKQRRNITMV